MAFSFRLCLAGALLAANLAHGADLITFWDARPRHGVNIMNRQVPDAALYRTARAQGVEWVRLAYDKWQPAQRDFLIGNADRYQGLVAADLATLRRTLDAAHAAGIKVVIAPLSLPGMRWRQNNDNRFDGRLWQDKRYWQQSADFWRDLAQQLKDHPAVAAYNLVNEPAPEKGSDVAEDASLPALQAWYRREQGGTRDLPAFYRQLTAAIRSVDAKTPLMLDGSWYASARGGWPTGRSPAPIAARCTPTTYTSPTPGATRRTTSSRSRGATPAWWPASVGIKLPLPPGWRRRTTGRGRTAYQPAAWWPPSSAATVAARVARRIWKTCCS